MVHRPEQSPLRRAFQCPLQIARSPLLDRCALAQLPEPPWYGPVCQVVWEGRSREAPPYPDLWHLATTADQTLCPLLVKADAASPTHQQDLNRASEAFARPPPTVAAWQQQPRATARHPLDHSSGTAAELAFR